MIAAGPGRRRLVVALAVLTTIGVLSAAWLVIGGDKDTERRGGPPTGPSPTASANPSTNLDRTPGASASPSSPPASPSSGPARPYAALPANAGVDYQIGGAYPPPAGAQIITRDRTAAPAPGRYNVCYVNGFQAQAAEAGWWRSAHADLVLTRGGQPVVDSGWNEMLLDISTDAKRASLAGIVGGWIDGCAVSGYQAVEVDNLDSWTRSDGMLTRDHAVAFARLLVGRAHAAGLAIGQKNTVELGLAGRTEIGFDFAVAEECQEYDECQDYVDVYGDRVIVIEYDDAGFDEACRRYGARLSIVRRDVDVTTPGSGTYAYRGC